MPCAIEQYIAVFPLKPEILQTSVPSVALLLEYFTFALHFSRVPSSADSEQLVHLLYRRIQ